MFVAVKGDVVDNKMILYRYMLVVVGSVVTRPLFKVILSL
jgi:hypothetical protein